MLEENPLHRLASVTFRILQNLWELAENYFRVGTQVPGTAMIPLRIATRLSMIKSKNIYLRQYRIGEKTIFHLKSGFSTEIRS